MPLPAEPWKPPLNSAIADKPRKAARSQQVPKPVPKGATVYAKQPPVTEQELLRFLTVLPQFRAWTRQMREEAHPIVNAKGQADFLYSPKAAQWVKAHAAFTPVRFFCIMGRMAACVAIIEEGNDLKRPRDMPEVASTEVSIARRHLAELLTAGAAPMPIN